MSYDWRFFKSARCVQVKLENGADLAALNELDQKLWTVLSASTEGLRFDPATLKLLDLDGDGRIRVPEVLAAVEWMKKRFKNLDFLFNRTDEIKLEDLDDSTAEGKALLASFKSILLRAGRADAASITLADVTGTTDVFNGQPFNGDGVVTSKSSSDAALSDVVAKIVSIEGGVKDRGGDDGIDQAKADAFFADAAAYLAWMAEGRSVAVLGDATADAFAAYTAVAEKIDAYFTPPEDLPLVADDPTPSVPLTGRVNPLWALRFADFAQKVAGPILGKPLPAEITRAEWGQIKARLAPYGDWYAKKVGVAVEGLGVDCLAALVKNGKTQAAVNDLIAKDLNLADEYNRLVDCERALRYARDLANWLCNFVNQANLYDPTHECVFRSGHLVIDGRECRLCFHVADEAAHAALAEKSKCCLLYVKLSRRLTGETREVCAIITAGSTAPLYPGRNGIFYDCEGNCWDAVVSKVIEAQVSLREAFWAPWTKIASTISDQCKKFLAAKQDAAVAKVGTTVTAAATTPPPAPAAPAAAAPGAIASTVAALGVGMGMAGAACAGLLGVMAGLPTWKLIAGVVGIVLLVSLPSVILAWFKLRVRDLGAILNACGWAVNRPLYFSMGLAKTFTRPAPLPVGAVVARDPYASGKGFRIVLAVVVLVLAALTGVCWKMDWKPVRQFVDALKQPPAAAAAAPAATPAPAPAKAK